MWAGRGVRPVQRTRPRTWLFPDMVPADITKVPHTLLLADDSVTIQRVIELTFADEDIKVIAVSDGDQAIAQLEASPPDIVLADIGMPGRNGYEVAEYIKQSPRLAHIPVVLLTGAFEPVDQVKATAAGCDGVLAKPFEPQLVIEKVKELLARPGRPALLVANLATAVAAEPWPPALIDPAPASGHMPPGAAAKVDDYFDRLDAAFASLSTGSSLEVPMTGTSISKVPDELDWFGSHVNPPPDARGDLSMPPPASSILPDLPLSFGSPPADFDHAVDAPPAPPQFPAPERFPVMPELPPPSVPPPAVAAAATATPAAPQLPRPAAPSATPPLLPRPAAPSAAPPLASLPPLADAFAALLAAEQGAPAPAWQVARVDGPAVTEDLVEQVTRRVLDRLSDRVVREMAADLVSATAERLIREEIERIKASLK
jgi:CheY-like chemotaxis protein